MSSYRNPFVRHNFDDDNDYDSDRDDDDDAVAANKSKNDAAIIQTAQDALETKWAAVQAGYYDDAFVNAMIGTTEQQQQQRRHVQPLIKRGTHARVCCMERAWIAFGQAVQLLQQQQPPSNSTNNNSSASAQVLVLGAGLDTSYFRWFQQQQQKRQKDDNDDKTPASSLVSLKWFEIDHAILCHEKSTIIEKHAAFSGYTVQKMEQHDAVVYCIRPNHDDDGSTCTIVGHDLREPGLVEKLLQHGLEPNIPTLILSECVQMYMPVKQSKNLIASLVSAVRGPDVILCSYEPILGTRLSQFGMVMERNMKRAGLATSTSGLIQNRTLAQHLEFARMAGGLSCGVACSLWTAYQSILTPQQRQRANACELLDELEEWSLIMQHYAFVMATNPKSELGKLLVVVPSSPSSSSTTETLMGFPKVGSEYHPE